MAKTKKTVPDETGTVSSTPKTKKSAAKAEEPKEVPVEAPAVQEQVSAEPDPLLTVVIPFKASAAAGNELQYAVRAWAKHVPDVRIVVIGDSLPWFGKGLIHIPCEVVSDNPQVDVAHKMATAIASDLVPESFVWSNDDIYTLCPVDLADIAVLKAHGRLKEKGDTQGLYRRNAERTLQALKQEGIEDPFDFATHTPVLLQKEYLAEVIRKFNCMEDGHLVYTLYANYWYRGHRPIITQNNANGSIVAAVYRENPDPAILKRVFENRKWIMHNDGGWKPVKPFLEKLFPEKCRFEK